MQFCNNQKMPGPTQKRTSLLNKFTTTFLIICFDQILILIDFPRTLIPYTHMEIIQNTHRRREEERTEIDDRLINRCGGREILLLVPK